MVYSFQNVETFDFTDRKEKNSTSYLHGKYAKDENGSKVLTCRKPKIHHSRKQELQNVAF